MASIWFHRLSYPRRQFYAIPYITELFYAGSAIILAVLIIINVALLGNDVVTVLKDTPDFAETKWWAPKWVPGRMKIPTRPGPCQPLTLPHGSTSIRTNSTLPIFSYTLMNGLGVSRNVNGEEQPRWYDAPRYRAEPLKNCIVQNITALINFQDREHKLTSQIVCDIDSADPTTPPSLKLSTTFSRVANTDLGSDDIVNSISSYAVPRAAEIAKAQAVLLAQNVTALTVLGVLDAIGSDLFKAMWAQKWAWKLTGRDNLWPDQAVVKWAAKANCTNLKRCRELGEGIEGIDKWYSNTRGTHDFDPDFFTPMHTTMYNYFIAVRDAIYLDLGHFDENTNVFLNSGALKTHILPDPFLGTIAGDVINQTRPPPNTQPYSPDDFWRTCTWGWGCLNGTWTDALLSNSSAASSITDGLPLTSLQSQYPTIIDLKYVCPVFKRKKTGAFLASVFVGTVSMYAVLYGIFLFFAALFDQQYRRKHGYGDDIYGTGDYEAAQDRHLPFHSSRRTPSPYATAFDAPRLSYTEPIPRYEPVPDHVFVRTPRKEDNLPPGACTPGTPGVYSPKQVIGAPFMSQVSLSQTTSRDTTNAGSTIRDSREQDRLALSPPRALVQTGRHFLSPQISRKPHHAERE
ncbi:transmembrane protein, putative [Rhizoctonia solani AG-3 Rhs1AP]|uniref:Transmembrane protein, putative n=1 Tax=Rhizoctonia solani AG-3 Rhs1AP TaxID=1086054 RepID=X8JER4_9AGAM|nr:transmembrane protein, putative [Rhizoctonia solani AG-3 Rhs1AP]